MNENLNYNSLIAFLYKQHANDLMLLHKQGILAKGTPVLYVLLSIMAASCYAEVLFISGGT